MLREVDSRTGNREEIVCPVCGESYGDFDRLRNHIRYNQIVEKKDDFPVKGSHLELKFEGEDEDAKVDGDGHKAKLDGDGTDEKATPVPKRMPRPTMEEIQAKLPLQELIVVVEGIDPLTSGTFQALHSYIPEEIEYSARFVPCLTSTKEMKATFVDLDKFHKVEPATEAEKRQEEKIADAANERKEQV